jgi:hypothetical protein
MEPSACSPEWLLLCQELYDATIRWGAEHPDAAPADIERFITTSCTYLRVHLTDVPTRQPHPAQPPTCQDAPGTLIRIAGICGYSHDGQVLYLQAAQSSTGIALHDIVRYVDDPTDLYMPLVAA